MGRYVYIRLEDRITKKITCYKCWNENIEGFYFIEHKLPGKLVIIATNGTMAKSEPGVIYAVSLLPMKTLKRKVSGSNEKEENKKAKTSD